ncbi:MAG: outer membrane protein transport protein [Betaproteobacteria bacterium]|nr:outer membrane protein transport protein [Betaproteobacteria bacterium]
MKKDRIVVRLLPAVIAGLFSGTAGAAGFQLLEQNASGIGNAYAGTAAVAQDASTIFFNPAGMTMLPGRNFAAGVDAVRPSAQFSNNGSIAAAGRPAGGNGGDAGDWALIPHGYLSWQLTPALFVGVGVGAPFGLATEYDPTWVGRFQAVKSEIKSINLNPSVAWKVNDKVSLGLGINYQRLEAELTSKASLGPTGEIDAKIEGDDDSWGWNAGALFQVSPSTRVGVAYRSAIKYTLEGNANFGRTGVALIDAALNANPAVANGPIKADIKMPDSFTISVAQQLTDRWEMLGDLSWTGWSKIQSLQIYRTSGALLTKEELQWRDTLRLSFGGNYKMSDQWKLRFGIAFDQSPVGDQYRAPRLPDNDRTWLSVGAQFKPSKTAALDFGYAYLWVKEGSINNNQGSQLTKGLLLGNYDNDVHILGVQYSQSF